MSLHSSQDLAIQELCKVKEDGWKGMESDGGIMTTSNSKGNAVKSSSAPHSQEMRIEQPKQTWIILE